MKVILVTLFLIGAVFANPITYNVVSETSDLEANTTESLSLSQSSENDASQLQNSAESNSDQSSESESLETTSEDTTSEESDSQSDEDDQITHDLISETRDDSMGSEENVRKHLVFANVVKALSAEGDNSTEVKGQPDLSKELTEKQPAFPAFKQGSATVQLAQTPASSSDTTSESADSGEITAAASDSSQSESSESNDASDESQSPEDSDASDSAELPQIRARPCVNATQSCESEELFQAVGDDGGHPVDALLAPDEAELSLRRR